MIIAFFSVIYLTIQLFPLNIDQVLSFWVKLHWGIQYIYLMIMYFNAVSSWIDLEHDPEKAVWLTVFDTFA